ncbi:MAG: M28 family peptidase [Planctomycetes bacterium]|nr:M28 family peptidase [Planctomycetota bacterium]
MSLPAPRAPEPAFRLGEMLSSIRRIVGFGVRRPGYPQGLEVERFLERRFVGLGLRDVRREPVLVNRWEPSETSLALGTSRAEVPCFPVPYTAWTGPAGIEAPLAYVGEGTAADFEGAAVAGRIAVAEARFAELSAAVLKRGAHFIRDPGGTIPDGTLHAASWLIRNLAAYFEAQKRGAAAFAGILADSPVDGCDHFVPYDGHRKALPAVWVGREHGAALRDLARRGEAARLVSLGCCETADSHNVVSVVPGTGEESVVVTSHHDAPFASAVEDASGLAVLLALAGHFGSRPGSLRRSLVFVASSGHFHGGIGSRAFVEKHGKGLLEKTVLALGVEHVAREAEGDGRGGYRLTGRPEVRAVFADGSPRMVRVLEEEVDRAGLDRTICAGAYVFGPEPPCDSAPFFTAGIPSACHISGPLYLFDPHDTVDKVRVEDLVPVARFFEGVIRSLDEVSAAELAEGMARRRGEPPPPPPPWFLPPEAYLGRLPGSMEGSQGLSEM